MMPGNQIAEVGASGKGKSVLSRRRLLKAGGATALLAGAAPSLIIPGRARAQQKTLKIAQWKHFVPSFDEWFSSTYIKDWGEKNDTQTIVDYIPLNDIGRRAQDEVAAGRGHDLFMFLVPHASYDDYVIDHREIYAECRSRYGPASDYALKSTFNPKTNKYFGFMVSYQPALTVYRKDLWDEVRWTPDSWDNILAGGRWIKLAHNKSIGFSLAKEPNSNQTMRAIMYSFGSSEQDAGANPALKSPATLEALKYVRSLYQEAMVEEVLTWDPASNNRFMLSGDGSLTLDTISIPRASESMGLSITPDLWLAKVPVGPAARAAPSFGLHSYVIWKFAENVEGAKQFLIDYVGHGPDTLVASGFQNTPTFPGAVPDLATLVSKDGTGKYAVLADVGSWTRAVGYPGFTNPAVSEVYHTGLIPAMFAQAATGQLTPEAALDQADGELRRIFQKWRDSGKI
jgi:multiple sugar transport system substrate-binding protein